ncbi:1-acyl-sn-glycerol-3-phosphate acyltransferase [Ekhidna sp.]|uniref:1-acyl-sn-glycerol-3-phosphate acyltransferase n=1 Tax=Ekhidna sp. TaxID=2608089 RepID=UPI003B50B8D7
MLKAVFKFFFKLKGWELIQPAPSEAFNCVMIAAPHTSNWDFVYAISAMDQLGLDPRFTIKKEFNVPVLGRMITNLGALWIDRTAAKKGGMTHYMAALFKENDKPLTVVVTPEGTRSPVSKWKTGFYHVALEAGVPICCSFMDYEKMQTGIGMCFMPSGVLADDMKLIMDYYKDVKGKFPENFVTDERYS